LLRSCSRWRPSVSSIWRLSGAQPKAEETIEAGPQPALDRLVLRLERVELDNRRLRRSLAAVVALGAVVAVGTVLIAELIPRAVEADRFVLRNSKGDSAAWLSVGKDDAPSLGFYGPQHKLRMLFGLTKTGSPTLGLYDSEQQQRVSLGLGNDEMPHVMLMDAQKKVRVSLGLHRNGLPNLSLFDPQQGVRATLSLNDNQDPTLTLFGAQTPVPRALFGLDGNSTGVLQLFSSAGGLNLNGSNGAVRWNPVGGTARDVPTQK
jgi:hypothetical protein